MYIISKDKDYYDGVVGSVGMDKTIVYERQTKEIEDYKRFPKAFKHKTYSWNSKNPFLNICHLRVDREKTKKYDDADGFIVGFCGSLYMGWQLHYNIEEWNQEYGRKEEVTKTDIVYGLKNATKYLKTDYWSGNFEDDLKYVASYDPIQIFRDYNTPIFLYDSSYARPRREPQFIVNPILKDWEFYKVVDSFTAFTELQMFISGVLGTGEKEIVEIKDKYKIGQHGFNKWSFRREPSKKK